MKKKKRKNSVLNIIIYSIMYIILIGMGFFYGYSSSNKIISSESLATDDFIKYGIIIFGAIFASYLQIIVHEAGHLIFGLISGYKFCSFRIGSFMWINNNDKIEFKRFSLAGTGGQCLLAPPDMIDGKYPVVLYNLGGSLMNIFVSILLGIIYLCLGLTGTLGSMILYIAGVGIVLGIVNIIPMNMKMISNDGSNTIELCKNNEARKAFWIQLKMNCMMTQGMYFDDMPEEWFYIPSDEEMKNSIIAAISVNTCNKIMSEFKFEECSNLIEKLLNQESAIAGVHKNLLICDNIYCEIMGKNRVDKIESMLTKELKAFMKSMKNFPSIIRTQYLYELLVKKDNKKANKYKEKLEKIARTYPYPRDIEQERKYIELAIEK